MATATVHKVLRNRVYSGQFEWAGRVFQGTYEPLITQDLWNQVQAVLDRRLATRAKKTDHDFLFTGLLNCGHCGCALVGEIKKGKYIYYHCSGFKGKCEEPYVRQEVLEAEFSRLLRKLSLDQEVVDWISMALKESHADKRHHHDEAVSRLKADHQRLQNRLETLYEDKLDGRIEVAFFDRKSREWRAEQSRMLQLIEDHQKADQSYLDEGVRILELAQRAGDLFDKQAHSEKRRLLNCVLAASSWKNGALAAEFRQPFDILIDAKAKVEEKVAIDAISGYRKAHFRTLQPQTNDEANWQSRTQKEDWLPRNAAFQLFLLDLLMSAKGGKKWQLPKILQARVVSEEPNVSLRTVRARRLTEWRAATILMGRGLAISRVSTASPPMLNLPATQWAANSELTHMNSLKLPSARRGLTSRIMILRGAVECLVQL
jgi:hypothetical protein